MKINKSEGIFTTENLSLSPQGNVTSFESLLRRFRYLIPFTAQAMGFYPFSVDHKNQLTFHWFSLPALLPIFHSIVIITTAYLYVDRSSDNISKQFSTIDANNVDRFGDSFSLYTVLVIGTLQRMMGLFRRNNVMNISERLQSILGDIFKNGTDAGQIVFEQELKQHARKIMAIYAITYFMAIVIMVQSAGPALYYFIFSDFSWIYVGGFVLGVILWNSHLMLFISKTLWFVHVIDLTKIGFSVLRSESSTDPDSSSKKISQKSNRPFLFCKHYEALDDLIHDFNEKFFLELTMGVVLLGILLVNSLYVFSGTIRGGVYFGVLEAIPDFVVHFLELFILCNSATWIVREAQATVLERMNNPNPDYDEALLQHLSYEQVRCLSNTILTV